MVRFVLTGMLLFAGMVQAQREQYVRPGLISAGMTITPTLMLNRSESNYYVSGHLEGRLDQHLSFRGETFYFVGSSKETPYFNFNTRTYFGLLGHINKGNFDSHIGFMPGLCVMQINGYPDPDGSLPYHVVPSMAANIGMTYYVWKFFNFFANFTYVHSTAHRVPGRGGATDEIMVSAGLGLNINAVKAK